MTNALVIGAGPVGLMASEPLANAGPVATKWVSDQAKVAR